MEAYGIGATNQIGRRVHSDWGNLNEEYKMMNELAVKNGKSVLSIFGPVDGVAFYVINDRMIDEEGYRHATIILWPEENEGN